MQFKYAINWQTDICINIDNIIQFQQYNTIMIFQFSKSLCQKHNLTIISICTVQSCQTHLLCQKCLQNSNHLYHHYKFIKKIQLLAEDSQQQFILKTKLQYNELKSFIEKCQEKEKQMVLQYERYFQYLKSETSQFVIQYQNRVMKQLQNSIEKVKKWEKDSINQKISIADDLLIEINEQSPLQIVSQKIKSIFQDTDQLQQQQQNKLSQKENKKKQLFHLLIDIRRQISFKKQSLQKVDRQKQAYEIFQLQNATYQKNLNLLISYKLRQLFTQYKHIQIPLKMNRVNSEQNLRPRNASIRKMSRESSPMKRQQVHQRQRINFRKSINIGENLERELKSRMHPFACQLFDKQKRIINIRSQFQNYQLYEDQTKALILKEKTMTQKYKGIKVFPDGAVYEGQFFNSQMHGSGRLIKPYSLYQGSIVNGRAHGLGRIQIFEVVEGKMRHSYSYKGQWQNQLQHGQGQQRNFLDEQGYEGSMRYGRYHGKGRFEDKQFIYEGNFYEGKGTGQSRINFKDGRQFEGKFASGMPLLGKMKFPNGDQYVGMFKNFTPHGRGELKKINGLKYVGCWINGREHGYITQIQKNGEKRLGKWVDGNQHQLISLQ